VGLVGGSSSQWGKISRPQLYLCWFIYLPAPASLDPFSPAQTEEVVGAGPTLDGQEGWLLSCVSVLLLPSAETPRD